MTHLQELQQHMEKDVTKNVRSPERHVAKEVKSLEHREHRIIGPVDKSEHQVTKTSKIYVYS